MDGGYTRPKQERSTKLLQTAMLTIDLLVGIREDNHTHKTALHH